MLLKLQLIVLALLTEAVQFAMLAGLVLFVMMAELLMFMLFMLFMLLLPIGLPLILELIELDQLELALVLQHSIILPVPIFYYF